VVDAVKALDMDEVHAHVAKQREEASAAAGKTSTQNGPQDGSQIPDF
jgi:thioredoxin 1